MQRYAESVISNGRLRRRWPVALAIALAIAGASAIFAGGPFERRWRDINTVTQQLQARKSYVQEVGAYLLGLGPNS